MAGGSLQDRLGAFCPHGGITIDGATAGPLKGLGCAVKDIYDIAGHVTSCGNPDWLATHRPAAQTAPVVVALLAAGARVIGKTITDELAYSLTGENFHYGTPLNPRCPDRIPGGSSSGSVSAVAGGAADFALGSDTGGSVRVPAALCGVFGIRTTHGRISLGGCMPLAPSFDTCGWFARDAALMERVGDVLLDAEPQASPGRLLLAGDAWALAEADVQQALRPVLSLLAPAASVAVFGGAEDAWVDAFRVLQAAEVWRTHGEWVARMQPRFGPGVAERFAMAAKITADDVKPRGQVRAEVRTRLADLLGDGAVLLLPSAPCIAPHKNGTAAELERYRDRTLRLTCIAGLAGLPQISLPLAEANGCPVGLSVVAAPGRDRTLLALARGIAARLGAAV